MNIDITDAIVHGVPIKLKATGLPDALEGLWEELITFKKTRQSSEGSISLNMRNPQIGAPWIELDIMAVPEDLRGSLIKALTRSLHGPCTFQIDGPNEPV